MNGASERHTEHSWMTNICMVLVVTSCDIFLCVYILLLLREVCAWENGQMPGLL